VITEWFRLESVGQTLICHRFIIIAEFGFFNNILILVPLCLDGNLAESCAVMMPSPIPVAGVGKLLVFDKIRFRAFSVYAV
jgi:hypothetical protein